MTREEAIHILQEDKALYETDICHASDGSPDGDLLEALDMAIEALKADRPRGKWIAEEEYGDLWVCDQCGFASEYRDNFCPNCGAKMDGERSEE